MDAIKIDLGKNGHIYVIPQGRQEGFASLYLTTNPDGGGTLGQAGALIVRGISYTVSAHRTLNANPIAPGGVVLAPWPTFPGGTPDYRSIYASRKGSFDKPSEAALRTINQLIDFAAVAYLKRPESFEEIRQARAASVNEQMNRLVDERKEHAQKIVEIDEQMNELCTKLAALIPD